MSPASEGSSFSFTFFPISQNPNPNLSSNPAHQPQSSSFTVGSEECNAGLNFDFSKMGPDSVEQPRARRLRYPLKKLRRKLGSGTTSCADSLGSERQDQPNEYGIGTSTGTTNISNNLCGGSVGGKEETGIFGNAGFTFGAKGHGSNSSSETQGFVCGNRSDSTSYLSHDVSFVFGAGKSCAELNSNIEYRAEKSSLPSNSNPKNEDVVFDAVKSSSPSNLSCETAGFVFGADMSSSNMKSGLRKKNGLLGVNAGVSSMKPSFGDGNFSFNDCSNRSSSANLGNMNSSRATGLSEENKQNFDNPSFVFGATKAELDSDSNLGQKGTSNRNAVQSEVEESNVSFFFSDNKTSVAAGNRTPEQEDGSDCIWKTVPDLWGKMKLDAGEVFEKDGHSSTMFGTSTNDCVKKDNTPFIFCAKGNGLESTAEFQKSKTSNFAGSADFVAKGKENVEIRNEFQNADLNGTFVFGCSGKEKLSPNGSNEYRNSVHHLNDEKIKHNSDFMTLLNDATRSNFKFVLGDISTPGSAFYKIPLSKLFDEMKSLNIDDSKGISGADKVKDVRSDSCFCSDHVDSTQNNGQMPGFSTGKTGATLQDQHKDANVGGSVKCSDPKKADLTCSNQGSSEYEYDLENGKSFRESVKISKSVGMKNADSRSSHAVSHEGVNLSFVSAGVFGKENLASNSDGTAGLAQQNSINSEAPSAKFENKENLSFTSTAVEPRRYSKEFSTANLSETSSTANPFSELNKKFEFVADPLVKDKKLKKTRRKLRQKIWSKPLTGQDHLYKEGSSPAKFESPGGCSPMDFSPYQPCKNGTPASLARERKEEEDATPGSQRFDIHENDGKSREPDNLNSEGLDGCDLNLGTSSSAQDGLSSIRRQYKKKYKLKVGDGLNGKTAARKDGLSSSIQFSPYDDRVQNGVVSSHCNTSGREHTKQDTEAAIHGLCEHWRSRCLFHHNNSFFSVRP